MKIWNKRKEKYQGSMTVEAAVILPVMLFFIIQLTSTIELLRLHGNLQTTLWKYGRQAAVMGYLYQEVTEEEDQESLLYQIGEMTTAGLLTKTVILSDLGKQYLDYAPVEGGSNGIICLTEPFGEEEELEVRILYRFRPFCRLPSVRGFWVKNVFYARAWTGYCVAPPQKDEDKKADLVYVTTYGKVYHESLTCSYLKRVIASCSKKEAVTGQNPYKKRYKGCGLCGKEKEAEVVYITPYGEKFHKTANCPSLVRYLKAIPRTQAEDRYPPCTRCAVSSAP